MKTNKQLDHKAWKAARKAGLIIHKVSRVGQGPDARSVFIVFVKKDGNLLDQFRKLFTAEEVIAEARETDHETFCLADFMDGILKEESETKTDEREKRDFIRNVDIPCVSSGA